MHGNKNQERLKDAIHLTHYHLSYLCKRPYFYYLKSKVLRYLKRCRKDEEITSIIHYLNRNRISVFPYEYVKKYKPKSIEVLIDKQGFKYVIYKGYRIYGKDRWTTSEFQQYFNNILIEQDNCSPHCYFSNPANYPKPGDVVADFGAAEGIFTIMVASEASRVYCFEPDAEWIEPLKRTLRPFKDKVEIVNRFVGKASKSSITMDDFFINKQIDFIKVDVEGSEYDLITNGVNTLASKVYKVLMVLYHKQNDETLLTEEMRKINYDVRINNGWMLYYFSKEFREPYLRHGVACFYK